MSKAAPYAFSRYLNVRAAYGPTFSSDGRHLAFMSNITGVPQAWQIDLEDAQAGIPWPEQLTFEQDRVMSAEFSPCPDDGRLAYNHDRGGNENWQITILSANGASEVCLTKGYEQAMHIWGGWAEDGQTVFFAANRRQRDLFDLYRQPIGREAEMVWQNDTPGYLREIDLSPDGRRLVLTQGISSFNHHLIEIDLDSGESNTLLNNVRAAAKYTSDGQALWVNTDLDSDTMIIARLDLKNSTCTPAILSEWDVTGMQLSSDGRQMAYAINRDGISEVHVRDLDSGADRISPALDAAPGVVVDVLTFSPDGTTLAFAFNGAVCTANIYLWDLKAGTVRAVTRSSHGGLPTASFVKPELIHYPTFDEENGQTRQIPAWFYKPSQTRDTPLPVVVMVHGGPESQYRPSFSFPIQYLVQNGYAVLAPNVRGSTGYGKDYSHLDDVEKRMDSVADLACAAYWLKAQPEIDGERVIVWGGSYGGFMVLAAVTTYPELWAAGVDIVGISNLATFLENTSAYRRGHREAEYGSLARDRDFLESIAPINHVDQITAPLIVLHGANDPRVPVSEAEQLVAALRERSVPVEFLVFDDEGHGVVKLKNKLVAYPAIVRFLEKI